ncbi:hypothetical protein Q5P01_000523 [Channa striata]|uniref:Uncharacterized protein n=1 Tax=Channa striata TaxID=64152 RepID=A0AA88IIC2_CHASR|nr:hypothetical protein Q5P01_000523 [Channa striata]
MALDEMEIRDLDQVTRAYAALLSAHVRLLRILLPRTRWKEVPVVVVFEQNTYVNSLADVKDPLNTRWPARVQARIAIERNPALPRRAMSSATPVLAEATAKNRALEARRRPGLGFQQQDGLDPGRICTCVAEGREPGHGRAARVLEARDATPSRRTGSWTRRTRVRETALGKLRDEMAAVVITESSRGCAAPRPRQEVRRREYTRDDGSPRLLLCHTRDEIHGGDRTVNDAKGCIARDVSRFFCRVRMCVIKTFT